MHTTPFSHALLLVSLIIATAGARTVAAADPAPAASNAPPATTVALPPPLMRVDNARIGGRLMADAAVYDSDDATFSDGTELRRARVLASGSIQEDWFFKMEYDLVDEGSAGFRDAYLGYAGLAGNTTLRVGQLAEYGSLEDATSSRNLMFMERAIPVLAFTPAEWRLGLGLDTHGNRWYAGTGVFGENAGVDEDEKDGLGTSLRLTGTPWLAERRVLHLGVWSAYRLPRGDDTDRLRARPEAHVDDTRLVDTHSISNVDARISGGLEGAVVYGPLSLQSEWMAVQVERDDLHTEQYAGWYTAASWFLTDDTRPYDPTQGIFTRVQPRRPAGHGGCGAWECALRYSNLDLNDTVRGGEESNWTFGLNWYPNAHVRFLLNYGLVHAKRDSGDVDARIAQLRTQLEF